MNFIKHKFFFPFVFLISALLALGAVYWYGTKSDLKTIEILSDRNLSFLQTSCSRYEHFVLGSDTKDLLSLRGKALVLKRYCHRLPGNLDSSLFEDFSREQGVDGILITDENLHQEISIGAYIGSLWNVKISDDLKKEILGHSQKTYLEHVLYKNKTYDIVVISRSDRKGLIFCYVDRSKNALLSSKITVQDMLGGMWFEKGAVAFIADERGHTLYTNDSEKLLLLQSKNNKKFDASGLYLNQNQDGLWYGRIAYYKNYKLGVFFPEDQIFKHRNYMISCYFLFIILFIFVIVFIKYVSSTISISQLKRTSKALRCIGEFYETVVSLKLDKNEIDIIKAPKELKEKMRNRSFKEALQSFVNYYASEEQNRALALMLNKKDLVDYLEKENYLEISVQENGAYIHNIEVVPQSKTEQGNVESVLFFVKVRSTSIFLKNKV